jgi:hypothetical protein
MSFVQKVVPADGGSSDVLSQEEVFLKIRSFFYSFVSRPDNSRSVLRTATLLALKAGRIVLRRQGWFRTRTRWNRRCNSERISTVILCCNNGFCLLTPLSIIYGGGVSNGCPGVSRLNDPGPGAPHDVRVVK